MASMNGPQNLTHKLLGAHLVEGELVPGEEIDLAVDQVLIEDATGSMTALQFEALEPDRVNVPLAVMYVDHNVLQIDDKNMDEHSYLRSFSARYGIRYSRPGNGISHYVHLERFAKPGELLVGADSHSTMAGALRMFAVGAGGLDVAVAMAGYGFSLECPKVVGVELRGELSGWVQSKDVILELLRRYGVRGGVGRVFEFIGEGVSTLSVTDRGTICNMITELGATAAVFPGDGRTREWLTAQRREEDFVALVADPDASYDETEVIELPELEPLIARPTSPGNVVPVREIAGTQTVQVRRLLGELLLRRPRHRRGGSAGEYSAPRRRDDGHPGIAPDPRHHLQERRLPGPRRRRRADARTRLRTLHRRWTGPFSRRPVGEDLQPQLPGP
jgi:aconitate hydratase